MKNFANSAFLETLCNSCILEKLKISLLTLMYQIKVLYQNKPGWGEESCWKLSLAYRIDVPRGNLIEVLPSYLYISFLKSSKLGIGQVLSAISNKKRTGGKCMEINKCAKTIIWYTRVTKIVPRWKIISPMNLDLAFKLGRSRLSGKLFSIWSKSPWELTKNALLNKILSIWTPLWTKWTLISKINSSRHLRYTPLCTWIKFPTF